MDAEHVHLRALARCAREAVRYRGRPPLDVWLGARVDEAIDDVLRDELRRLGRARDARPSAGNARAVGGRAAGESGGVWRALAAPLGLEPVAARCACAALNAQPEAERRACYGVLVEGVAPAQLAGARAGGTAADAAQRARRALGAALAAAGLDAAVLAERDAGRDAGPDADRSPRSGAGDAARSGGAA